MAASSIHPRRTVARTLLFTALACTLFLVAVGPAFAADGVRVLPDSQDGGNRWQSSPDVSGSFVTYIDSPMPPTDVANIALKSLLNDHTAFLLTDDQVLPAAEYPEFKNFSPRILDDNGTIYVVWTRLSLVPPYDSDIWIWRGTYDAGSQWFTADAGFPKALVTGTIDNGDGTFTATTQSNPAIGLVNETGGAHVIVAWEDDRDNGYWAPLIYAADLTTDVSYQDPDYVVNGGPATLGTGLDATDTAARGQHAPDVSSTGVYWLDDRWSFWSDFALKDTAVWRADPAHGWAVAPYFTDSNHTYDNGFDAAPSGGPKAAGSTLVWLRSGPYGGADNRQLFYKTGAGTSVAPSVNPLQVAASPGASPAKGFALAAAHADRANAIDTDLYFFDPVTRQRIPVCDRGNAAGADPDTTPGYWRMAQYDPSIGAAPGGFRVLWSDNRDAGPSAGEDTADARLYQAFVPTVTIKAAATSIKARGKLSVTVTVAPDFTGAKARLQLVKATTKYGATVYTAVRSSYSTDKILGSGSKATWVLRPTAKGTYLLRGYFFGEARYGYDGATVATAGQVAVPHVPNVSRVVKLIVK